MQTNTPERRIAERVHQRLCPYPVFSESSELFVLRLRVAQHAPPRCERVPVMLHQPVIWHEEARQTTVTSVGAQQPSPSLVLAGRDGDVT